MPRKKKEICLFTGKSILNLEEYKKMVKNFPMIYWKLVAKSFLINLLITFIVAILIKNKWITLGTFLVIQILLMLFLKIILGKIIKKTYLKKYPEKIEYKFEFYENYLNIISKDNVEKIEYPKISKYIETDSNVYLYCKKDNLMINIQKKRTYTKIFNFLKEKLKPSIITLKTTKVLEPKKASKVIKEEEEEVKTKSNFIKYFMFILFLLTVATIYLSNYSLDLLNQYHPQYSYNSFKNLWILFCFVPIPFLSFIIGIIFLKRESILGFLNILSGIIIGFALILFGSFSIFMPTFGEDYSKINKYRNVIDAKLPNSGGLQIKTESKNNKVYHDSDKHEYEIVKVYYANEDVTELVDSIKNGKSWFLSKTIDEELAIFIPSRFKSSDDIYYSIYNETLNQYNVLPEENGEYVIYTMEYDESDKILEMHKFKYNYNK